MTIKSIFIFLGKYLSQNWIRVLLASSGVVVGIWSITLTTSLSLGVSEKIVTAINSQPGSKSINIQQEESGATNLFALDGPPKFKFISPEKIDSDIKDIDNITELSFDENLPIYVNLRGENEALCIQQKLDEQRARLLESSDGAPQQPLQTTTNPENCYDTTISISNFSLTYEQNKNKWFGKTDRPVDNEVISCFVCNPQDPLHEKLSVDNPNDLVGKEIDFEYVSIPAFQEAGEIFDVLNLQEINIQNTNPTRNKLKIVSVIDDSSDNSSSLAGRENLYGSKDFLEQAVSQLDDKEFSSLGFTSYSLLVNDFNDLEPTIDSLQDKGYLASSPALLLIQGIQSLFIIISIILGLFGLIALVASIFGIANVMAISVLKRQKEIGILKSLGARNSDIFKVFSLESLSLGVVGWLIGTVLGLLSTTLFTIVLEGIINNNDGWKTNLTNLGITDLSLPFDPRITVITLILACTITLISGLFPAIRASRSNPVETLKSE